MKIKKNGKVINLTESDLKRIVKRVLKEQPDNPFDNEEYQPPPMAQDSTYVAPHPRVEQIKRCTEHVEGFVSGMDPHELADAISINGVKDKDELITKFIKSCVE